MSYTDAEKQKAADILRLRYKAGDTLYSAACAVLDSLPERGVRFQALHHGPLKG